jgi:hypothetical protein
MKKMLFIGVFALISSTPAYPAAVGNSAGHGSGGQQTGVIPTKAISNNAIPSRRHHRVYGHGTGVVQDTRIMSPRNHRRRNSVVQQGGGLG